jgi:hypothetical protein
LPAPLLIRVRASRSPQLAWWLWCGVRVLALGLGIALPVWLRAGTVAATAWLAWRGHCQIWCGRAAVRQLRWDADGQWLRVSDHGLQSGEEWVPPLRQRGPWLWVGLWVAGHKRNGYHSIGA